MLNSSASEVPFFPIAMNGADDVGMITLVGYFKFGLAWRVRPMFKPDESGSTQIGERISVLLSMKDMDFISGFLGIGDAYVVTVLSFALPMQPPSIQPVFVWSEAFGLIFLHKKDDETAVARCDDTACDGLISLAIPAGGEFLACPL